MGARVGVGRALALPAHRLLVATDDYDRVQALKHGRVGIDGFALDHVTLEPGATFTRLFRGHEFDVSEMSFSTTEPEIVAPLPVMPAAMAPDTMEGLLVASTVTSPPALTWVPAPSM